MSLKKSNNNLGSIAFVSLLSFSLTLVAISKCLAEGEIENINAPILFQPPSGEERPEKTDAAASRQDARCSEDRLVSQQQKSERDRLQLTPIVPDRFGLTVAERPTFWVYLPKTSAKKAILSIKEKGANPHWQQSISLTGKTGILGIRLLDDAPALEIGKQYQWAVVLVCGNRANPNDPFVTAGIKRVAEESPVTDSSLSANSMLEKANIYAKKGIWYDSLDMLISEKKSSLSNWNNLWTQYLKSAGLGKIANQPILGRIQGSSLP
ncbi:DUF928 domain-containing protein [Pleurocapsa sp. PCC 7319]|uniref:DUF928 domain-containing protein n=1 Tax=Pleurocapsa sp. PCC 7319 TaxID=118161 RepID=UPI0003451B1B|nr:DUF928 domain-containing protein [Pleurocapsa sp. PCC 7319]